MGGGMAGGQKKVIVRTLTGVPVAGYLPAAAFCGGGEVQLLEPSGKLISLQLNEIKLIAYVRDFNMQDSIDPDRLSKRTFPARPRSEGLWVKVSFVDGDSLEGTGRERPHAMGRGDGGPWAFSHTSRYAVEYTAGVCAQERDEAG